MDRSFVRDDCISMELKLAPNGRLKGKLWDCNPAKYLKFTDLSALTFYLERKARGYGDTDRYGKPYHWSRCRNRTKPRENEDVHPPEECRARNPAAHRARGWISVRDIRNTTI